MRDELYIINPPTSSYDNPIPLDSLKYMKDKLLGVLENPEILDKLGAVALGLYDTAQMLEPMEWVEGAELGEIGRIKMLYRLLVVMSLLFLENRCLICQYRKLG